MRVKPRFSRFSLEELLSLRDTMKTNITVNLTEIETLHLHSVLLHSQVQGRGGREAFRYLRETTKDACEKMKGTEEKDGNGKSLDITYNRFALGHLLYMFDTQPVEPLMNGIIEKFEDALR